MQGNGKSRCRLVYKLLRHSSLLVTAGSQTLTEAQLLETILYYQLSFESIWVFPTAFLFVYYVSFMSLDLLCGLSLP